MHLLDIIWCQDVVRIEDKITVKTQREITLYLFKECLHGVTFADIFLRPANVCDGAVADRGLIGIVGAVVGHDEGRHAAFVGLAVDAVDEIAYYGFFVSGADEDRVTLEVFRVASGAGGAGFVAGIGGCVAAIACVVVVAGAVAATGHF